MSQLNDSGIDPKIWGRPAWDYYHYVTFNYPVNPTPEDKDKFKTWARTFGETLPCKTCSEGYLVLLDNPLYGVTLTDNVLINAETIIKWGHDLHNEIEKKVRGQQLSYVAFLTKYINVLPPFLRQQLLTLQNRQFGNNYFGTTSQPLGIPPHGQANKNSTTGYPFKPMTISRRSNKFSNNIYLQMKPKSSCATCGRN